MDTALFADPTTRTVKGMLLPYGEVSRRSVNTEPCMFARGDVRIPSDPIIVGLNNQHARWPLLGHAAILDDGDAGITAEFQVANTPEGDELLKAANDPDLTKRPRLSAEIANLVRRGVKASGDLVGAAIAPMGAFASAGLFELAPGEEEVVQEAVTDAVTETAPEASPELVTTIADAVIAKLNETTDAAPAEGNPEGQFMTGTATIPAGVKPPATPKLTAAGLFAAIASRDHTAMQNYSRPDNVAAFAIEGLQHSGPSSKTVGADTQDVGYLGEIWQGNPYQRKFWPLFASEPLTSYKATGWKWDPANAPEVDAYAGNLTEVHSNALDTIPVVVDAIRVAGGNRLDRRYLDFNDQQVIASYFRKLAEHYARFTDAAALAAAVSAAGSDLAVTGTTYPYGSPVAIAGIIDGALQVLEEEATPSFAVVSPELWRDIALVGKEDVLGYLQAGFGLESGSVDGFSIRPGNVGTGKVLVGAKQGLQVFEFGGSPIRVDALAVHNGAVDGALYGYYATLDTGLGLSIVDTTDYTAPEPPTTIVVEGA